jgi:hypothetical protein
MLPRHFDTTRRRRGFSKIAGRVAQQKQMHPCGRATSGSVSPVSTLVCVCLRDMHGSGAQPPMPSRPFHHTKQDNAAGLLHHLAQLPRLRLARSQFAPREAATGPASSCYCLIPLVHPISVASSACVVAQSHDRLSTMLSPLRGYAICTAVRRRPSC